MTPGSLVSYRQRDWVVLPSADPSVLLLRPLGGSQAEICPVHKPLMVELRSLLPWENVTPSRFPPPSPAVSQDATSVRLLLDASRLLLRDGAAPFRSLGRLSVRPRPYQFVPLLMALRLDTVRLLIADDVGVGKTIEGALIAREMLDRGLVDRIAVLCPPYLCEQWQSELADKFSIQATVMRSGTIARLERQKPIDRSVFEHHRHFVASIDLVKGERYRAALLQHCPPLVLVDEAHGAAAVAGKGAPRGQQQRHELLCALTERPKQHIVLLTATPHSGVEESFTSLLGLLRPEFRRMALTTMDEEQRRQVADHFVQRRRIDVSSAESWHGNATRFPTREALEESYAFSEPYRSFYTAVHHFARGLVESAEALSGWRARMRFWSALALLRCVTSSPAAAEETLRSRLEGSRKRGDGADVRASAELTVEDLDETFEPLLYEPGDAEAVVDAQPGAVLETQARDPAWSDKDQQRLRDFAKRAATLRGEHDAKLACLIQVVESLLAEGLSPIVWCRYIATSDYLAAELEHRLSKRGKDLRVASVTGTLSDDERRLIVDDLGESPRRVLVATDCLSEGINLQASFNAVIHYDLPWNPNRLEQREGRVDRFGQTAPFVKAVMIYGQDNPVDGAVLDVLLRKARDIHRALGIYVPVPVDSQNVMDTILKSLFSKPREDEQMALFFSEEIASDERRRFQEAYDEAARREKQTRTIFAQRAIRPEEVRRELDATDAVLGDPVAIASFLREASQRLGFGLQERRDGVWEVATEQLPPIVRGVLGDVPSRWPIAFEAPVPEGADFIGRSHRFVEGLAEHLVDAAFASVGDDAPASRCGAIRTQAVERLTTLYLLRIRYLIEERSREAPGLGEETLVWGVEGLAPEVTPLDLEEAMRLLEAATPSGNISSTERAELLTTAIEDWTTLDGQVEALLNYRADAVTQAHRRVRSLTREQRVTITPKSPPDLLGVLVLLPTPKGVC